MDALVHCILPVYDTIDMLLPRSTTYIHCVSRLPLCLSFSVLQLLVVSTTWGSSGVGGKGDPDFPVTCRLTAVRRKASQLGLLYYEVA